MNYKGIIDKNCLTVRQRTILDACGLLGTSKNTLRDHVTSWFYEKKTFLKPRVPKIHLGKQGISYWWVSTDSWAQEDWHDGILFASVLDNQQTRFRMKTFAVYSSVQPRQFRECDDLAFIRSVYVSEAMWTIFKNKNHHFSHIFSRLCILKEHQKISYHKSMYTVFAKNTYSIKYQNC